MFPVRRPSARPGPLSGALIGLLLLAASHAGAQPMTLNLKDADLSAVIATVSELTGKNFIVDPRVKGKVTVVSSQPLEPEQIYDIFLSILSVHGFAAVPSGGAIKIVPEVNAKQGSIPSLENGGARVTDQYVTEVIPLGNVDPTQLVPILRPLVAQQGHLAAVPGARMLVIAAEASNVRRLSEIVRRIDKGGTEGIEVITLQHAAAADVVRVLQNLQQGSGAGGQAQAAMGGGGAPTFAADERTNSVLISGPPTERLRLRALVAHLDTPTQRGGNTEVIYLRYANARDLVQVLSGVSETLTTGKSSSGSAGGGGTGGGGNGAAASSAPVSSSSGLRREGVSIQAEPATNALVVTAPPDVMASIKQVVQRLDVRRAQVLVEAVIAELSYEKSKSLGVQWAYDGQNSNGPVGLVNFARPSGANPGVIGLLTNQIGSTVASGVNLVLGDTSDSGGTRFGAFIQALAQDSDTNILSTPTLVTMDNEEAQIVVGQNVPFVTGSYSSTGTSSSPTNPFQTIQRQDVGLTLRIKPQINEGNAVKLEIVQEVSNIATNVRVSTADIVTNKRSIKTVVMVDSGNALVLGGLIEDQMNETDQRVPLLGDIPVLGHLFSYNDANKVKRNLMIFLHPVIMRDNAQNASVSGAKYNFIREQQLERQAVPAKVMPQETKPLMPEWNQFLDLPPPFEDTQVKQPGVPPPPAELGAQGQL